MPYLLTSLLKGSGLQYQSLFQGERAQELKERAPYLVELREDNDFTLRLMTGSKGINGLWDKELGIYIRSRACFAELRKHFRKFTRIQDQQGKWFLFRFWEPCILRDYLYDLRYETGKIMNWFGQRAAALTLIALCDGGLYSYALAKDIPPDFQVQPTQIEKAALARQHARRVMEKFALEQDIPFDWETYEVYNYPYQDFELED